MKFNHDLDKLYEKSYKVFQELEVGDILYIVSLEDNKMTDMLIEEVQHSDNTTLSLDKKIKDCLFKMKNGNYTKAYNGNSFMFMLGNYIYCSDKRIAMSVKEILDTKCNKQFEMLNKIFNNNFTNLFRTPILG